MTTQLDHANPFSSTTFDAFGSDPFAPASDVDNARYVMTRNGPDVNAEEYERADATSIEVMILWGETVLALEHLTPSRSYYVGSTETKGALCDYPVPEETLGMQRAPIVLAGADGSARAVLLPGAKGSVFVPGKGKMTVANAIAAGLTQPCVEVPGARELPLTPGCTSRIEVGQLAFQVGAVKAGRKQTAGLLADRDWSSSLYTGLSMAVHACLLAAVAMFMPPLGITDSEAATKDQLFLMKQYLSASAEREAQARETNETTTDTKADDREGGTGTRANGEEGKMGNPNSRATNHTYGVQGRKDNPDPHLAREAFLREAQNFGMIGLINTATGGDPNAPTAPWGRDNSEGTDSISARGNMWGEDIGEASGGNGLGLSGIGEGGGGRGEGIGLGNIGNLGRGAGLGDGQGIGNGHGRLSRGHTAKAPPGVRFGVTESSGRLPPEVIQRVVRQNYGRFRVCYENGLRTNPNLQGRVSTRFIISREGAVTSASNGGSDIPDPGVVSCVIRSFYGMSFPEPKDGIVTVTYPIMFTPGG
ncbi:MAG: AgmX/PglI C-terminal domain-containing protein [Deltaproteobacteria bacterium]|nr:AgmX/PglI C-terminal domain-containing protein [Deltaproteobacteria bacterium]